MRCLKRNALVLVLIPLIFQPQARAEEATRISQFGISWVFQTPTEFGRFANEDLWVKGPVTIVGIDPPSTTVNQRTMNGSMINPSPRADRRQGYDSSMYGRFDQSHYEPSLNVALGVSVANPVVLQPGSSLVSTISEEEAGALPQIRTAAILTVLQEPPRAGSFRPPYSGSDKTVKFNKDQLDLSLLARLAPVDGTPSLATVERYFERPWIDHVPNWVARHHHPRENMPDYGRDMAEQVGIGALMLHLDFTAAEKQKLLVRYVQLGIDLFGVMQDGGEDNWTNNGGHASGRKWPILFAGLMLGASDMKSIGSDLDIHFGEDDQTFYVEQTSPGVYNHGHGGYIASDLGLPEWGQWHATDPNNDNRSWTADNYRTCCTATAWQGFVLAAHIMNAKELWGHDALFDYQDRYMRVTAPTGSNPGSRASSGFSERMWDTYRARDLVPPAAPGGLRRK